MANSTTIEYLTDDRAYLAYDTSATLAEAQSGLVINVEADAQTITLPATVVGYTYTIRNGGVKATDGAHGTVSDQTALVTIDCNGSDKIMGMGMTASDGVTIVNTKATSKVGDEITLIGDGANGWFVQNVKGVWAQGA